MRILATIARVLLAAFALASMQPALAANAGGPADPYSPSGIWDIKVGGVFEGEVVKGQAYIEFGSGGSVSGYYLSRMTAEVYDVIGTWTQNAKKFQGSIEVMNDGGLVGAFAMTGSARADQSIAARMTDGGGSSISLVGKPFVEMSGLAGTYAGTLRQYGMTGFLSITLTPDTYGGYEVSGLLQFGGEYHELAGYALVNRSGKWVAYVLNLDTGVYSSLWGSANATRTFSGVGKSLDDGSSIRMRVSPAL